MRNSIVKTLAITSIVLGLTACSGDEFIDTQKPVIQLNTPKEGVKIQAGSLIELDMQVSDDQMLGSYKVDIHENSEGHVHAAKLTHTQAQQVEFSFHKQWSLAGQLQARIQHTEIEIPENAEVGMYHFVVYVLDAAGNQSMEARNFEIVTPAQAK